MQSNAAELRDLVDGISCLSLSGSGSSEYAGDSARPALRKSLNINVETVSVRIWPTRIYRCWM
jgi:fructoselysine-6-P-deglycase FrlB-like protein